VTRLAPAAALLASLLAACGPAPRPADAYASAPDLVRDMLALRAKVRSLRAAGRADHYGERGRVQGKIFAFAKQPGRLRVDLMSPFGSTLAVLTADGAVFRLSDLRESRYYEGPAEPCNIARLIGVPLAPEDAMAALAGSTPIIEGSPVVTWDGGGFYRVRIEGGGLAQTLEIGPSRRVLPLRRSLLERNGETVFDMTFDRWLDVGGASVPHEIRVSMPREKAELLVRYDEGAVEVNVDLPDDAFTQTPPPGTAVESVSCK
jgi:outer membrane lipoprotein-sorting protein